MITIEFDHHPHQKNLYDLGIDGKLYSLSHQNSKPLPQTQQFYVNLL